jgi:hypothetical protein
MAALQPPLKEVLEVLLECFETVASEIDFFSLAYAIPLPASAIPLPASAIPCYQIWFTQDLDTPPSSNELSSLSSFPPESLPAALVRWNMCEAFAYLLENEADRLVSHLFGATVEWTVTEPRPALVMFRAGSKAEIPLHSFLKITEKNGQAWIMDGTVEQFGWPHETWFLEFKEFCTTRLGGNIWRADSSLKSRVKGWFGGGFWAVARERMEELFDELEYGDLFALPREERVQQVKAQAKAKFAGAWQEAFFMSSCEELTGADDR